MSPSDSNPLTQPTKKERRRLDSRIDHPWGDRSDTVDDGWQPAEVSFNNPGVILEPGDLLVTHQGEKSCYRVNPKSGRVDFLFTLARQGGLFIWRAIADSTGTIYCSYSGSIGGKDPFQFAGLGTSGGVLSFEHRELSTGMPWLPPTRHLTDDQLIDPIGFQLLPDGRLLVAEMNNWGGVGSVVFFDQSGTRSTLVAGGRLIDPVKAIQDADGIVWIANGNQVTQDGEVIRVDPDGRQSILVPKRGHFSGCMVDVLQSSNPNELVVTRDNLPVLDKSSIEIVDKKSGRRRSLIGAEPGRSRFFSQGDVFNGSLWVAETIEAKLLKIDLETGAIDALDLRDLLGGIRGVRSSFDVVESVSVVPHFKVLGSVRPDGNSSEPDSNARPRRTKA